LTKKGADMGGTGDDDDEGKEGKNETPLSKILNIWSPDKIVIIVNLLDHLIKLDMDLNYPNHRGSKPLRDQLYMDYVKFFKQENMKDFEVIEYLKRDIDNLDPKNRVFVDKSNGREHTYPNHTHMSRSEIEHQMNKHGDDDKYWDGEDDWKDEYEPPYNPAPHNPQEDEMDDDYWEYEYDDTSNPQEGNGRMGGTGRMANLWKRVKKFVGRKKNTDDGEGKEGKERDWSDNPAMGFSDDGIFLPVAEEVAPDPRETYQETFEQTIGEIEGLEDAYTRCLHFMVLLDAFNGVVAGLNEYTDDATDPRLSDSDRIAGYRKFHKVLHEHLTFLDIHEQIAYQHGVLFATEPPTEYLTDIRRRLRDLREYLEYYVQLDEELGEEFGELPPLAEELPPLAEDINAGMGGTGGLPGRPYSVY